MYMILIQATLLLTALVAGKVCASKSTVRLGILAFAVLELGYLVLFFGPWWVGLLAILLGCWIVFRCERKAQVDGSKANA